MLAFAHAWEEEGRSIVSVGLRRSGVGPAESATEVLVGGTDL